jgi:hypothetical protein
VILTEIDELVTRLINNKREIEGDLQRKRRKIGSKEGKVKRGKMNLLDALSEYVFYILFFLSPNLWGFC